MPCYRQYVSVLEAILIIILVFNLTVGVLCEEEKGGNLSENKYGLRQKRLMRSSTKSETTIEDIVS